MNEEQIKSVAREFCESTGAYLNDAIGNPHVPETEIDRLYWFAQHLIYSGKMVAGENKHYSENEIVLKVDYPEHDKIVLTNNNGNTYAGYSEELIDFIQSAKPNTSTPTSTVSDQEIEEYVKTLPGSASSSYSSPDCKLPASSNQISQ